LQRIAQERTVPKKTNDDLREACITEALAIIETLGIERLSLREVSRRLGVSHQAPYKHFPSRDHILAEIVRRAFESFAAYLDSHRVPDDPIADFEMMGRAYLDYAQAHPLQYRLMFSTPLPNAADHPEMMASANRAFDVLRDSLQQMRLDRHNGSPDQLDLDALFVWSANHGLAMILQTQVLDTLLLSGDALNTAAEHLRARIAQALGVRLPGA
jgi:AcrR family transcriptional regulator